MEKTKKEIIKEGLESLGKEYPNSIIADMLSHFDEDTVLRFMTLYSGRQITVPKVNTIWTAYRNKIIVETLLVKNDRVTRMQLAEYFGISEEAVRLVFHRQKNRSIKITNITINKVVETVYRKYVEVFHKEMKQLFSDKYGIEYFSLHDMKQNPEDLFLLREAKDKMIGSCKSAIRKHPIFIGREYKLEYAIALILKKIDENH